MLQLSLLITSDVPIVMALGIQTLLSELLVIPNSKALFCNVALYMSVG